MKDVDYGKAIRVLPDYCIALMQNVPEEDQQELSRALKDLEEKPAAASVKALLLGLS